MVKKIIISITIFLVTAINAHAQNDFNFYSDVSPKSGTMDDTFILSVVIENASQAAKPYLLGGDDFEVQLLGPRQSTVITNGVVRTELAYNYQLIPKRDGVLESPSAEIEMGGKKYTANSFKVKVEKSGNNAGTQDKEQAGVILRQSIDANKVYVGQQVRHTLSLYAAVAIHDYSFSDEQLDGFWTQNIGDVEKSLTALDNQRYNLFRWNKAIYPLRAETINIPERKLNAKIQVKAKSRPFPLGYNDPFEDPFDSFFGRGQIEQRVFSTGPLKLEVIPLPEKPANFQNWGLSSILIGATDIEAQYDKNPVQSGESKTVTIQISSRGNLNAFTKLPLKESSDYRIYQDNSVEKNYEEAGELVMNKIIKLSIIPLKPGTFSLPPIRLGYFDPKSASYKEASTPPIQFEVSGADLRSKEAPLVRSQPQAEQTAPLVQAPQVPEEKYQEETTLQRLSSQISLSLSLFILAILLCAGILFALLLKYAHKRKSAQAEYKPIKTAQDVPAFARAISKVLSVKLSLLQENLFGDQLRLQIEQKIHDTEARFKLQALLDRLDDLQFGKDKPSDIDLNQLKKQALEILSTI